MAYFLNSVVNIPDITRKDATILDTMVHYIEQNDHMKGSRRMAACLRLRSKQYVLRS
jgi:hypothetical protein